MSSYTQPPAGGGVPAMSFPAPIARANALSSLHPPPETPKRHSLTVSVSDISEIVDGSGRFIADAARETLINAARDGDESLVKKLLESGTNINAAEISGKTALQAAAESGHEGMVALLLNAGASLVTPAAEYSGRTALQAAAERGYGGIVKRLLNAGAKIDAPPTGDFGRTALQAAAGSGHMDVVEILLSYNANVNAPPSKSSGRTALQAAAEGGHEDVVMMLLRAEAYVDAYPSNFHGRTALQAAAGAGHEDIVKILLESGASIDAPPSEFSGRTALQAAAGEGRENIVSLLLKHRANINAPPANSSGRTALQAAAEAGHERIVKMLIDAGADTDAPISEFSGKTALQAAAGGGHEEIVRLILEAEISTGAAKAESYGAEALEAAVNTGQLKIVKMLLDAGVNINTRNSVGRTCLFSLNMNREMLQELVKLGAFIDHVDYDGMTPLHYAAENGCKELLIILLDSGADMEIEDNRTRRPLHLALEKKHEDLVKVMLGRGDNIRESRVKSWRAVLNAGETDIIMISEGTSGANDIKKVDIDNAKIGIETEDLLPLKQFYNANGLRWDDPRCKRLVDPWNFMSKYLALPGNIRPETSGAEVQWIWALVNPRKDLHGPTRNYGIGIPNIGNIATTAHTKALLVCYAAFDFVVHIPPEEAQLELDETPQVSCFHTEIQKTQISWIMRKAGSGDQQIFRSMNYRSTLEYGCVPRHGVDFFTLFIEDLHNKWLDVFHKAEEHLKQSRKNLLLKEGQTTSLIRTFLRDAQLWSDFRTLYKQHVKEARALVKDFREKRLLYDEVNHFEDKATLTDEFLGDNTQSETSSTCYSDCLECEKKKKKKEKKKEKKGKISKGKKDKIYHETKHLDELIDALKKDCRENIKKLEKRTKDMIELEFNLVSIFEARISTTTAQSMKRLTWITFIFLPLLFVASLFGMNLDILETGPVKWWWYVVLSFSLFVMVLAGWAMFKYYSTSQTVSGWCGSLVISLWNKLPPIPIPSREKSNLMEDLENGSHKNSKFKST